MSIIRDDLQETALYVAIAPGLDIWLQAVLIDVEKALLTIRVIFSVFSQLAIYSLQTGLSSFTIGRICPDIR